MATEELLRILATSRWFKTIFESIKNTNRFILDSYVLNELNNFLTNNKVVLTKKIPKGTNLYRARKIPYYQKTSFKIEEMLAPPPHKATAGRMNPVGIPYLYTADNEKTAILELRPWKGSKISVATLETLRDLKLFNSIAELAEKELANNLYCLNELFSLPNDPEDAVAYTPTQYMSEIIKNNNYDGIFYKSSLCSKGYNIAIFDTISADLLTIHDVYINDVEINYSDNIAESETESIIFDLCAKLLQADLNNS